MKYQIRCFISNFKKMFTNQTEEEQRLQGVEQDVNTIKRVLSIQPCEPHLNAKHFDAIVSASVMQWLDNWVSDKYVSQDDLDTQIEEGIENHDFTDSISDALDDAISNRDWDYELREAVDWDRVADKVVDKIDWSDVISDNCLLTSDDIDINDLMLQSEQMSDDDVMKRSDLSDEIVSELKRDWFTQMLKDEVKAHFKSTLSEARQTEEENVRNCIDDEIEIKLDTLIREQMSKKFGEQWDNWYNENTRHCVKVILGEFLAAAYEQTKEGNK